MSLLILMYHRASPGRHGNAVEQLDTQFGLIARRYANVLPGQALQRGKLNVCLTFDDGYFDFYVKVFPLLRKHRLRAVLAIPPVVMRDVVEGSREERLALPTADAFSRPSQGGFCTWKELQEMVDSGLVVVAAHGFTHQPLDHSDADLVTEIDAPKVVLSQRLGKFVDSFMFPYGRYSGRALRLARKRYQYVFRIGGALNRNWNGRLLYRIDADAMRDPAELFEPRRLALYRARYYWNRLRRR
jgi:peptidoglycan/xylan/chitin deacetylase (PgdA/CDA1 family)